VSTIRRVGWLPIAVFLAHEICAHVIDAYRIWPSVDIPLHLLGGFAIAYFSSGAVRVFAERGLIREPDPLVHVMLVLALACTAAVFWEFAEWTADRAIGTGSQLGLDDTMLDLLMGVLGGATFALALLVQGVQRERRGHPVGAPGREANVPLNRTACIPDSAMQRPSTSREDEG
jgi:hypothetical protein